MIKDPFKIPDPSKMKTINPELFSYGYSITIATEQGAIPAKEKSKTRSRTFIFEKGGAGLLEINPKDRADVRAIMTAVDYINQFQESDILVFIVRFLALKTLIFEAEKDMSKAIQIFENENRIGDLMYVCQEAIHAGAQAEMNVDGLFKQEKFYELLNCSRKRDISRKIKRQ